MPLIKMLGMAYFCFLGMQLIWFAAQDGAALKTYFIMKYLSSFLIHIMSSCPYLFTVRELNCSFARRSRFWPYLVLANISPRARSCSRPMKPWR